MQVIARLSLLVSGVGVVVDRGKSPYDEFDPLYPLNAQN